MVRISFHNYCAVRVFVSFKDSLGGKESKANGKDRRVPEVMTPHPHIYKNLKQKNGTNFFWGFSLASKNDRIYVIRFTFQIPSLSLSL